MDYKDYKFDFEKLDVYQKALEFTNQVFNVTKSFNKELQYSLGDQFRRAALSICNNLAEGSQKSSKSRYQFYGYSLNSARECIPMIKVSVMQGLINKDQEEILRSQCLYICNMLGRLSRSVYD